MKVLLSLIASLLIFTGCDRDTFDEDTFADWVVDTKTFQTDDRTFSNNEVISIAGGTNNKLYIKFGTSPTTATTLKVVDYFKATLAADEVTIGIAQGDFHYLSTGTDNKTLTLTEENNGLFTAKFSGVTVIKYDVANTILSTTNASGRVVFRK